VRRRPRRRPRSAAAAALALVAIAPASARAAPSRFTGEVTDALRTPVHRLKAPSGDDARALADLLFVDHERDGTSVRACVRRRDTDVRTCFAVVTGAAGSATLTPLRFPRGRYVVRWRVKGRLVASWRFAVV
jgi:hypothetical protein